MDDVPSVRLFVMKGCQVCPQMERLFADLLDQRRISALDVVDLASQPERAERYHVRSVPFYLIDEVAFTGLRTRGEIDQLLARNTIDRWAERLADAFGQGNLGEAEQLLRDHAAARQAMVRLLQDDSTELVVRIGLSAVIESLGPEGLLNELTDEFIGLTAASDARVAMDALYYLQLIGNETCVARLRQVARSGQQPLASEAGELLAEMSAP